VNAADPLVGLARAFADLLPTAPAAVPPPPPLTGEVVADLASAWAWWEETSATLEGRVVVLVDQAEQIEAIARRAARAEAERSGNETAEDYALGAGWWRLSALLALLADRADPERIDPALIERARAHRAEHPTSVVLGLHRESALERWPLDAKRPLAPMRIEPLHTGPALEAVIRRRLGDYGLVPEEGLLDQMLEEAVGLANVALEAPRPDGRAADDTPKQASVLPQLIVALGTLIEAWTETRAERGRWGRADRVLELHAFGEAARIEGAIDRLGERTWSVWTEALVEDLGVDPAGYFGARTVEQERQRRFGALMQRLVDAATAERQDLGYLRREGREAIRYAPLIEALRRHRFLTTTDESYFLLPHRSILDHWKRAKSWLAETAPRFALKAKLRRQYEAREDYPEPPRWTVDEHERLAVLASDWIGSGEGEDGALLTWLREQLVVQIDPEAIDVQSPSPLGRLPFDALAVGEPAWADQLITRVLVDDVDERIRVQLLIMCAQQGETARLVSLLGTDLQEAHARANAVHEPSGTFALLMAAENGHTEIVKALLDAGAEVNRSHHEGGFPLLIASQDGHAEIVKALIAAGADVNQIDPASGAFALLVAAEGGHTETVTALLAAGADVEAVNETNGSFALLMAAQDGYTDVVEALLAAGADVERTSKTNGNFALLMAAQGGHTETVKALLAAGADIVSVIPLSDGIGATLLDGQSTARADMTCSVCRLAQK